MQQQWFIKDFNLGIFGEVGGGGGGGGGGCLVVSDCRGYAQATCSGGSRIYKRGGHKIMGLLSITKTSKWEVVKNSASPKRPFIYFFFWCPFSLFRAFPVQIITKHTFSSFFFFAQISLFHLFLNFTLIQKGGSTLSMPIHFPIGTHPHLAKKGGGACA